MVQVLSNLLSNGTRHSPESSAIRISAVREDAHVAISVSDEGRGLPPERLAHPFRKHVAPEGGGLEGRRSGHGLGLSICKGLVEAHEGRIRAESAGPGRGTTIVFTVPVADEAGGVAPGASPGPSRPPREDAEPTRILVVDDDPRTLRLVRDALSAEGYAPVITGDHHKLARILRTEKPALAVLDLVLPGADGIELMTETPELSEGVRGRTRDTRARSPRVAGRRDGRRRGGDQHSCPLPPVMCVLGCGARRVRGPLIREPVLPAIAAIVSRNPSQTRTDIADKWGVKIRSGTTTRFDALPVTRFVTSMCVRREDKIANDGSGTARGR